MSCWFVIYVFLFFVLYKLIDRLIRIPRIGRYADRYILVTGCDTGFGNILAKRLDQLGCHVFAGCLTETGETELRKVSSGRLHVIRLDVTKTESIQKALECVKSKLPPGKGLWGLVNNAGVNTRCGVVEWLRLDDYKALSEVNLWGMIEVTLTFLPLIKKAKGRIVITSSILGRLALREILPYCISKYGVEAFTDGLRRSVRVFGCKTLLVEPGAHNTPMMNLDACNHGWRKSFDRADPQLQAEYGKAYLEYAIEGPKIPARSSDRLTDVPDAYEHALFGRFPRARYVVGWDAVYFYHPLQLLPEWLADWILEKLVTRPLPAALGK